MIFHHCRAHDLIFQAAILSLASSSNTEAALFRLEWRFRNNEMVVVGQVDTVQDALFVHKYEATRSQPFGSYLRPDLNDTDSFPDKTWKFTARRADGAVYDIPDNWNGHISAEWGLISDLEIRGIPFANGRYGNEGYPLTIYPGIAGYKLVSVLNLQPPSFGGNDVSFLSYPPSEVRYGTLFGGVALEGSWL